MTEPTTGPATGPTTEPAPDGTAGLAAPPTSPLAPSTIVSAPPTAGRQGNYAGGVTRLVAFAADVGASWGIFTVSVAAVTFAIGLVTGHNVSSTGNRAVSIITLFCLIVWLFVYFAYQWALSGKTVGMALLGIRVVATDGAPVTARQAVIRTITLPLSFLFFGLGFLGILLNKDRHAWHDRMAKTVVVYSWDARAARLRWLAKQETVPAP